MRLYPQKQPMMLTLLEIKDQTRPHLSELCGGLNLSIPQILEAYDWVCDVIYDFHRVYEPYHSIKKGDVKYFFEIWCSYHYTKGESDDQQAAMFHYRDAI